MTRLLVRDLDPGVIKALKKQAAKHGRSAEAEHREILKVALLGPNKRSFAQVLLAMPNVGEDEDFERIDDSEGKSVFS